MRELNDMSRDVRPRAGSPLWWYLTLVTLGGLVALGAAVTRLWQAGPSELLHLPLLWVIAALALIGELRPIVTPGKSGPDSGAASITFCFAALLYWGFAVAAPMLAIITAVAAVMRNNAAFRAAFNAAQYALSLAAAGLVLALAGLHPSLARPWLPEGGQLLTVALAGVAYFAVNYVLVCVAVALHSRTPIPGTLRKALPYQAFVNLVLLSAAPLVVVVMGRSVLLVLLFLLPLSAIYANAAMSVKREHQALHDELTGLPNRSLLLRRSCEALAEASASGTRAGFLLLDLDRFKEVNDTLGHPVGDALLRVVAGRLAHSVRPGDLVARLGGDEFAVLLPSVREGEVAREVAARLRAALAEPVRLEGMSFEIEASIGVALYPTDAASVEVLMQRADVAMYLAKERHTGVEMYASEADRNSPARLSLLGDLRRGIDHGELEVHYQPKVRLADGRTVGMEALVRWRHPSRGLIMPAEFLPAAEQSYLMRDVSAYVIDAALAQAARWRRNGTGIPVSLNLSARDLLDAGLAAVIEERLRAHGLPPTELMVEVSECALAGDSSHVTTTMAAISALGVPLCLDDFGTGYSSLVRLKRLAVAEVKIDASFITRLAAGTDQEVIVKSLVELVRALGIRPVALGVETAQAAAALRAICCDGAQGWFYSAPLEPARAAEWLTTRRPATGHIRPGPAGPGGPARSRPVAAPPQLPSAGAVGR